MKNVLNKIIKEEEEEFDSGKRAKTLVAAAVS